MESRNRELDAIMSDLWSDMCWLGMRAGPTGKLEGKPLYNGG